jgi:hypothetical protein
VVHRRSFRLDRPAKTLQLEDHFEGSGHHLFELFFHFFPGVEVKKVGDLLFLASAEGATILLKFSGTGWDANVEPAWVSERYGRKANACKLVLVSRQTAPVKLATTIQFAVESPNGSNNQRDVAQERACLA